MATTTDLEEELRRNLRLRRELGVEVRLELLTTDARAKANADYQGMPISKLVGAAWIALGLVAVAFAAFIVIWLT